MVFVTCRKGGNKGSVMRAHMTPESHRTLRTTFHLHACSQCDTNTQNFTSNCTLCLFLFSFSKARQQDTRGYHSTSLFHSHSDTLNKQHQQHVCINSFSIYLSKQASGRACVGLPKTAFMWESELQVSDASACHITCCAYVSLLVQSITGRVLTYELWCCACKYVSICWCLQVGSVFQQWVSCVHNRWYLPCHCCCCRRC